MERGYTTSYLGLDILITDLRQHFYDGILPKSEQRSYESDRVSPWVGGKITTPEQPLKETKTKLTLITAQ